MRRLILAAVVIALLALAFLAGRREGRREVAAEMNDLLSVGFRVIDPEGFEIERWEE